jgi:peptidoglycan/xylan/chitin deacetylase (PgdA/CDA1 family)
VATDRISPSCFETQVAFFRKNYQTLSLSELAECIVRKEFPRKKALVITFDDGYADNYVHAYPIMREHSVPATMFLTTGHIGTGKLLWTDKVRYTVLHSRSRRLDLEELGSYSLGSDYRRLRVGKTINDKLKLLPNGRRNAIIEKLVAISRVEIPDELSDQLLLSWEKVAEMSRNGIDVGAHSVTHPILTKMPLEQARTEILQSKKEIERRLGKAVRFFAYPNGDFNTQIANLVRESGFVGACAVGNRWVGPHADTYRLWRVVATEDFNKCMILLSGFWGDLQVFVRRTSNNM